jgi:hypothetical protein
MKFLNIFKKKQENQELEQSSNTIASVTYSIDKEGEMFVDINIDNFDEEPVDGLAQLISVVSTVKCQLITIEMIKQAFSEEGKIAEYIGLISKIASNTASYTEELKRQDSSEEPYIKPSDMF